MEIIISLFFDKYYDTFYTIFRGLLMPNFVEDEHGITRTDGGLLGSGIYFSDTAR